MRLSIGLGAFGKLFATVVVAFIATIALSFLALVSPRARRLVNDILPADLRELLPSTRARSPTPCASGSPSCPCWCWSAA
ncbi:hypothetical protein ACFQV2_30175 [Actinokineospora soli]|uniref:Uncharacterized protein n=1 Tax=Actinokineospora soli TaxID=1048753 RepID=A0ABW2TV17_9PSEU